MNKKIICMSMSALLVVLNGCARDRTIEDYRNDQQRQVEAQINAAQGDYRGMFVTSDGNNSPIGGLTIHVEADTVATNASNAPEIEQSSVVKATAILDDGTSTMSMTFNNGAFVPGSEAGTQQFSASNVVTGRGTADIKGTFSSDTLTGNLEVDGYPDRGGHFTLSRNASSPSVKNIRTRAGLEKQFLFNSFITAPALAGSNSLPGLMIKTPNTPVQLQMVMIKQASVQDQDFMDVLTPYRVVDVSIFESRMSANGTTHENGGVFPNSTWDIRKGHLEGTYNVAATATAQAVELKLTCDQTNPGETGGGWICQEISNSAGLKFNTSFQPSVGGGNLQ